MHKHIAQKITFKAVSLSVGLCLVSGLLSACAQTGNNSAKKAPDIIPIDRSFTANAIPMHELRNTAADIKTRYSGGPIVILVRYVLQHPYAASKELAFAQGETVRNFLTDQDIKHPIDIILSPADIGSNTVWISYHVDRNKGDGVAFTLSAPITTEDIKSTDELNQTPMPPSKNAESKSAESKNSGVFNKDTLSKKPVAPAAIKPSKAKQSLPAKKL